MFRVGFTLLLTILPAQVLLGATLLVPSEYPTVALGLDAAVPGDTVLVAAGTYSDAVVRTSGITTTAIGYLRSGLTLLSESGPGATALDLKGQGTGLVQSPLIMRFESGPQSTVIDGFLITGAPVGHAGLNANGSARIVVKNCMFRDLDSGSDEGGGIRAVLNDLEIYGSRFENCRATLGGAIFNSGGNTIVGASEFVACEGSAIRHSAGSSDSLVVRASTFRENTGEIGAAIRGGAPTIAIENCKFVANTALVGAGAVALSSSESECSVRSSVFLGNAAPSVGGMTVSSGKGVVIERNTLVSNSASTLGAIGAALRFFGSEPGVVRNNIFAYSSGGAAFHQLTDLLPESGCNAFWSNDGGDFFGYDVMPTDVFANPLFCDRDAGDLSLSANSPCVEPNSGGCGQIGAEGVNCGVIAVEGATWGSIKARYSSRPGATDDEDRYSEE